MRPNKNGRQPELDEAIKALRERDQFKRRELDAMITGMASVQSFIDANRGDLDARRGGHQLDAAPERKA